MKPTKNSECSLSRVVPPDGAGAPDTLRTAAMRVRAKRARAGSAAAAEGEIHTAAAEPADGDFGWPPSLPGDAGRDTAIGEMSVLAARDPVDATVRRGAVTIRCVLRTLAEADGLPDLGAGTKRYLRQRSQSKHQGILMTAQHGAQRRPAAAMTYASLHRYPHCRPRAVRCTRHGVPW